MSNPAPRKPATNTVVPVVFHTLVAGALITLGLAIVLIGVSSGTASVYRLLMWLTWGRTVQAATVLLAGAAGSVLISRRGRRHARALRRAPNAGIGILVTLGLSAAIVAVDLVADPASLAGTPQEALTILVRVIFVVSLLLTAVDAAVSAWTRRARQQ